MKESHRKEAETQTQPQPQPQPQLGGGRKRRKAEGPRRPAGGEETQAGGSAGDGPAGEGADSFTTPDRGREKVAEC